MKVRVQYEDPTISLVDALVVLDYCLLVNALADTVRATTLVGEDSIFCIIILLEGPQN